MSNNSNSFVRHEMLEERAPPVGEGGVLKWVRENLFSSVFNTCLLYTSPSPRDVEESGMPSSA